MTRSRNKHVSFVAPQANSFEPPAEYDILIDEIALDFERSQLTHQELLVSHNVNIEKVKTQTESIVQTALKSITSRPR